MVGTAIGIAAWGLITGVAMGNSGLRLPLMIFMSLLVFAGSAQLAVLPLMTSGAPIWVVWATALCVNLRFVIFSAIWRPYLIEQPLRHAAAGGLLHRRPELRAVHAPFPRPEAVARAAALLLGRRGAELDRVAAAVDRRHRPGRLGAGAWGFGFAGTLALMGLTLALLTDRATGVAGAVAACAAVAAYALPLKLNIVVAIAAAVAIGLLIDHTTPRGQPAPVDDGT